MRIIVIDYSEHNCRTIKRYLNDANYSDVLTFNLAKEAFEKLALADRSSLTASIDLIIISLKLPDPGAIEVCTLFKKYDHLKDIPIIVIISETGIDSLNALFEAGVTDYILKPVKKLELIARVRVALSLKKEIDQRKEAITQLSYRYEMFRFLEKIDLKNKNSIFQEIVNLLPFTFRNPQLVCVRLIYKHMDLRTSNFKETNLKYLSDIIISGVKTGTIEVYCLENIDIITKEPFTQNEMLFVDWIAKELSTVMERDLSQENLFASEEKFRTITETAQDAIMMLDNKGKVTYWNPAAEKIFGYASNELINKDLHLLLVPERYHKKYINGFKHFAKTGNGNVIGKTQELSAIRKDGTEFFVELSVSAINIRGEWHSIAILRDITERKQMESRLKISKEAAEAVSIAKSRFLASMSHEIRTPLNAIIGVAELLSKTDLNTSQKNYVNIFKQSGNNLLHIINGLLDFSKIESGQLELDKTNFDLTELLNNTIEIMALSAHIKDLELMYHIFPDVPRFLIGDQNRLAQIIINLIGNAIKFTDRGEIILTVKNDPNAQSPGSILFSVSDTGIGIPEDKIDKVFFPFTQLDSSSTRKYGGTGLGLAISKNLVKLFAGKIWAESTVERGSVFYFTVRLEVQPVQFETKYPKELNQLHILIIDDNKTHCNILREVLEGYGAIVKALESAEKGITELDLSLAKDEPYNIILLDQNMPQMNGFQVADYIKHKLYPSSNIIMMFNANYTANDIAIINEMNIPSYLIKPIKEIELINSIESLIRSKQEDSAGMMLPPKKALNINRSHLNILLAEDQEMNSMLIRAYFDELPYTIDLAENGKKAVDKFKSGKYDLILMDIQMPEVDGYIATKEIRQWEKENNLKPTPIIALTAYAYSEDKDKALESGCDGYISKPFRAENLLAIIYEHTKDKMIPTERIPVKVDSQVKKVLPTLFKNIRDYVENIKTCIEIDDYKTIKIIGHGFKGAGKGYGLDLITEIGKIIEQAAVERNKEIISQKVEELMNYINNIEIV